MGRHSNKKCLLYWLVTGKSYKQLHEKSGYPKSNYNLLVRQVCFLNLKIMINKRTDDIVEKAPLVRKTLRMLDRDSLSEIVFKSVPEVAIDL